MKKLCYLPLILLAFSCGEKTADTTIESVIATGKADSIKAKRKSILKQYDALGIALEQLDQALVRLNPNTNKIPVTITRVRDTVFKHFTAIQGNVKTKQNLVLFSEYSGILNQVYAKEGDTVKKGQLLARIDDGGMAQRLLQAQAQAQLAETTFERQKRLWDQKIGSEMQYLQAKTQAETARQNVHQLQSQLTKTQIHAPFNGTIEQVFSNRGEVVAPGSRIMRVVNLKNMYIQAEIPENYIKNITLGDRVSVHLPSIGKTYEGVIRQVSNFINPSNRSFGIQVSIPNRDGLVKPNLIAKLEITDYKNPKALVIPQNVIRKNASGREMVYTLTNRKRNLGRAEQVIITTGFTTDSLTEVLSGLQSGEILIAAGAVDVNDGDEVLIENTKGRER